MVSFVEMTRRLLTFLLVTLLAGCATTMSGEWEFREFADLPKADLSKVYTATLKKSSAKLKLSGGRNAVCDTGICIVSWSKPKLTLFRNGNEGKTAARGNGTFTLDQVETMELQAGLTSAAGNDPKLAKGRINNLGYQCSPTSCRLTLFFYTEKNDLATEDQILTGLLGGRFYKE